MANEVKLPRLGQGMESGTIVKWLKGEGDPVEKGEPLYELDTDKVTQEVESDFSGVLLRIEVSEGEAEVGRTVAVIGEQGEEVAAAESGGSATAEVDEEPAEEGTRAPARDEERERGRRASTPSEAGNEDVSESGASRVDGRVKASPLARRIARERGIELLSLSGTGPEGRIVAEDVERAAVTPTPTAAPMAAAAPGDVEQRPLSSVRRTIARRLTAAWTVPVFQLVVSADMTQAQQLIASRRELRPDVRVTVTDLLTKVSAAALVQHPDVNVQFTDDALLVFPSVGIGLAVTAPQGLVVPVIRLAERLSLGEIAAARADLVGRAREGKLQREDFEGGTFTISNLGMYGVEQFTAVINPPQAAILAVGATEDRVVARDGEPVVRPMTTISLTCDHRAVDGAPAADFLRTVQVLLEQPALAL